eukprot:TRINITY_DN39465_c0_g1_i2.p1 TRINITY_DN39465_c0_g1~~TRINITY_DN39465_c0_g1_i2.p1  ORF type:complete len:283 (+),score=18.56 TRINITY_DN39465_c0_g1_i2:110-958(+)
MVVGYRAVQRNNAFRYKAVTCKLRPQIQAIKQQENQKEPRRCPRKAKMKRSLTTKLMIALTVIIVIVAGLILAINYTLVASTQQEKFERDIQAQIDLINSSMLEPVFTYDFQQIEAISKSLVNTALITSIKITDHRGKDMAKALETGEEDYAEKVSLEDVKISKDDKTIGLYDIVFSKDQMETVLASQLQSSITLVVLVMVACLGMVLLLSRRIIVSPVAAVSNSLAEIAAGGGLNNKKTKRHMESTKAKKGKHGNAKQKREATQTNKIKTKKKNNTKKEKK